MHEHHQVDKIVKELLALAEKQKLSVVKKVSLVLGDALGFDDTSVKLYFESFTEGTIAENAELIISHKPAELECKNCLKNFIKLSSALDCPACGQQGHPTDKGKEFFIKSIA